MRRITTGARVVALALALASFVGCRDELPTLAGYERFPEGTVPSSIQFTIAAGDFLALSEVHGEFTRARHTPFLLVAGDFDGSLSAHTLASFGAFPDTVTYPPEGDGIHPIDSVFEYVGGRVRTTVSDTLSIAPGEVTLLLWELLEEWDHESATWEFARSNPNDQSAAWQTPGGTRGQLVGTTTWAPGSAEADTVSWSVGGEVLTRLADDEIPGLLVTMGSPQARLQLSRLHIEADIRPETRPDTTLVRSVGPGPQTFVFSPEAPRPAAVLRAGGVESARVFLRMMLAADVPVCPELPTPPDCPRVPLRDVTVNAVQLVLDPLPVAGGFRPAAPMWLAVREVFEPDLGRWAPLGDIVSQPIRVPQQGFQTQTGEEVVLDVSGVVIQAVQAGRSEVAVAVQIEPEASTFGYAWFGENPRLRFLYTLPSTPRLP